MKNTQVTLASLTEDDEYDPNEGPDEMFRFVKVMKV